MILSTKKVKIVITFALQSFAFLQSSTSAEHHGTADICHTLVLISSSILQRLYSYLEVLQGVLSVRSNTRRAVCLAEFLARRGRMVCRGSSVMLATRAIVLMDGLLTVGCHVLTLIVYICGRMLGHIFITHPSECSGLAPDAVSRPS